jgi:hypothetical protein
MTADGRPVGRCTGVVDDDCCRAEDRASPHEITNPVTDRHIAGPGIASTELSFQADVCRRRLETAPK